MLDRIRQALRRPVTGGRRPASGGGRRRLTAAQVKEIRRRVAAGDSQRQVAADNGISQPAVYAIINRYSYKDVE